MNGLGEQFLARAALARDQHARIGCRNHLRLLQNLFHALVARDDLGRPAFLDIGRAGHLERLLDRDHEFVFVDRLGQETERAALRRNNRIRNRAVRRDDHDAQSRRTGLQLFQQPDAVHLVHAQVGDDEVGREAIQRRQRLVRALDGLDVVTLGAQANTQQAQQSRIVIDEQDLAFGLGGSGRPYRRLEDLVKSARSGAQGGPAYSKDPAAVSSARSR